MLRFSSYNVFNNLLPFRGVATGHKSIDMADFVRSQWVRNSLYLMFSLFCLGSSAISRRSNLKNRHPSGRTRRALNVVISNGEWIKSIINGPRMRSNLSYLMHTSSPPSKLHRRVAWADNHTGVPGFLHHESDRNLTSRSYVTH
jgi:hypothetical protein